MRIFLAVILVILFERPLSAAQIQPIPGTAVSVTENIDTVTYAAGQFSITLESPPAGNDYYRVLLTPDISIPLEYACRAADSAHAPKLH
jgi:hypothetical protein